MAVFTSTQELDQQAQHKNFQKQTGWKKTAMMLSGYKDTGEKSWYGKYFGGSPMQTIGGNVFSKGSSAEEVVKSQRSAEIGHQIGVAKFVGSIMTAGAGGAAGGAASGGASAGASAGASGVGGAAASSGGIFGKAGTMKEGGSFMGNTLSKFGGGQGGGGKSLFGKGANITNANSSMFKEGSKADNLLSGDAGQKLTNELTAQGKQKIMDEMNSSGNSTTKNESPNEDNYSYGEDENGNPISAEAQAGNALVDTTTESGSAKAMGTAAGATSAIPIIGEGIGLYAEKMAIADAHTAKRKEIAGRTYQGNQGRRV